MREGNESNGLEGQKEEEGILEDHVWLGSDQDQLQGRAHTWVCLLTWDVELGHTPHLITTYIYSMKHMGCVCTSSLQIKTSNKTTIAWNVGGAQTPPETSSHSNSSKCPVVRTWFWEAWRHKCTMKKSLHQIALKLCMHLQLSLFTLSMYVHKKGSHPVFVVQGPEDWVVHKGPMPTFWQMAIIQLIGCDWLWSVSKNVSFSQFSYCNTAQGLSSIHLAKKVNLIGTNSINAQTIALYLRLVNQTFCWTLAGPLTDWQGLGTDAQVCDSMMDRGCWMWGWAGIENGEVGVGN